MTLPDKYIRYIPTIFFVVFSFISCFKPSSYTIASMSISGGLMLIFTYMDYEKHKSVDEAKEEITNKVIANIQPQLDNVSNKVSDLNTNISKISLGNSFKR